MLYLMRHGEASAASTDSLRPLSARGRDQVGRIARHLEGVSPGLAAVHHSGKLRARQTAEIVARALGLSGRVSEVPGLLPEDDPMVAQLLAQSSAAPLLLVGHLPHLGSLASLLVLGDPAQGLVAFGTATVACLERAPEGWQLRWVVSPEPSPG